MIITIDGPVATGKSTVARKLAQAIGFIFFDTGAMYRALTYAILQQGIDSENPEQLASYLKNFDFHIKVINRERRYFVGNEDVTEKIRTRIISNASPKIAAIKAVRDYLVALQRQLAVGVNAVFEGRDMGTVVFPDAQLKVFLTGSPDIRAKRRHEEVLREQPDVEGHFTLEQSLEAINKRDYFDSNREHSPLQQASDAFVIDTSNLTADEVVYRILEYKENIKSPQS